MKFAFILSMFKDTNVTTDMEMKIFWENPRCVVSGSHNSTEHPKLISIPYIYPIGQDIAIEIGYLISIQKYV